MWGDDKMPFRANGLLFIMFTFVAIVEVRCELDRQAREQEL